MSFEADPDHFSCSFGGAFGCCENLDNAGRPHSITLEHADTDDALLMLLFDALESAMICVLDNHVKGDALGSALYAPFSDASLSDVNVTFEAISSWPLRVRWPASSSPPLRSALPVAMEYRIPAPPCGAFR